MKQITETARVRTRSYAVEPWHGVAVLICFVLLWGLPAAAQFDTGTIAGTVTDPNGAVIPNAAITITNTGTSVQKTAKTDGSGSFVATALPFGNYVVSAAATGFSAVNSQPIMLNVGATVHVSLQMAMAATQENIVVTGTTSAVNTASSAVGTTLNSTEIANLPI